MGKKSVGPSSALVDLTKSSHFAGDREARGVRKSVPMAKHWSACVNFNLRDTLLQLARLILEHLKTPLRIHLPMTLSPHQQSRLLGLYHAHTHNLHCLSSILSTFSNGHAGFRSLNGLAAPKEEVEIQSVCVDLHSLSCPPVSEHRRWPPYRSGRPDSNDALREYQIDVAQVPWT
jgi:hypothetical protein